LALARNAAFNFMGAGLPALLTVVTLPVIVSHLGTTDFGVLALVTAIVGYFALLDINVTAGSTKYVAQFAEQKDRASLDATVCFGFAIYATIGVVGLLLLFTFAEPLVTHVFSVPPERHAVAADAVRVAALGFLLGQVQAYLQSLPGALMRYDVSGRIEAAFGSLLPLLSVALLLLGGGLVELVWLRVAGAGLQIVVLVLALRRLLPGIVPSWPEPALRRALLAFSGWAFLSRMAAVTYTHADKLIIGARIGVSSLTYYVVPTTLGNRVMGLVQRLSGVMFPHASAMAAAQRHEDLARHYVAATRYMFFVSGAIALTLALLSRPLLTHWLNAEFARLGGLVMVLIALGQWVDSMTNLPSLVNDGLGHPRVSGLFALGRALLGLVLIVVGVSWFGIEGAAGAHLAASLLGSGAFLFYVHGRTVPVPLSRLLREAWAPVLAALALPALLAWALAPIALRGWPELLGALLLLALAFGASGGVFVLRPEHRRALIAGLRGPALPRSRP
jgi:O-antigen/teichoic acid export membrane protein